MIQANELRIGNTIQDGNGFEMYVVAINYDGTVYCDFDGNEGGLWEFDEKNPCYGVELTEEILLEWGFLIWSRYFSKGNIKYESNNVILNFYSDDAYIIKNVKYLHQLQNLFFYLTGEELTKK